MDSVRADNICLKDFRVLDNEWRNLGVAVFRQTKRHMHVRLWAESDGIRWYDPSRVD
jgi:hypothetical protein